MASDWIKMDTDLPTKAQVFKLSKILDINRYEVVGRLLCFWAWIDKRAVDGLVDDVDADVVDDVVGLSGFARALVDVRWLKITSTGITIPDPDKHQENSAKVRSLKSERQRRWRENKRKGVDAVDASTNTPTVDVSPSTREEKRREDIDTSLRSVTRVNVGVHSQAR